MTYHPGAKKVLVPGENKRDLGDFLDGVRGKLQPVFYYHGDELVIKRPSSGIRRCHEK